MNLVLVESPAKGKTIEKYLGKEYKVRATLGHIIDLPKSDLGVDVENDFKPQFETIQGKKSLISKLKKEISKDGNVYLAMDPDREGEAIAHHVATALKLKKPKRIAFNEITKSAVTQAVENPRDIDDNLVQSQFARRVLDRLVGYKLSELLWKKMWYGLSAGRVQSVALRLIVEREEEIESFIPKEYWEIFADLLKGKEKFNAKLEKIGEKKASIKNEKDAKEVEKNIGKKDFKVLDVKKDRSSLHAYPPFTTSTLQQSANRSLGYSAKRTMSLAQSLYQNGHITYMRTDSTNLSSQAIDSIRKYISGNFEKEYLPEKPNFYKTKVKNAQEAHEAIRPTDISLTPEQIAGKVDPMAQKLYSIIWKRALASQMADCIIDKTVAYVSPIECSVNYIFEISGMKVIFEGFRKILRPAIDSENAQIIGDLKVGDNLNLVELQLLQKYTKPKSRYTEAMLIKMLEKLGIGRPSTYATIISTILERGYIEKLEKFLVPKEVGRVVNKFLKQNFNRLVDFKYTADVENSLDDIATGEKQYSPFIKSQYDPLISEISVANKEVQKEDVVVLGESDEKCPECKGKMIIKLGKNGKFLSCAKFPECKGIKSLNGEDKADEKKYVIEKICDKCQAEMLLKTGKWGKFWACSKYPECKNTKPLLLLEKCPECKSNLVEKTGKWGKTFIGCSGYPNCKYIKKAKKKS